MIVDHTTDIQLRTGGGHVLLFVFMYGTLLFLFCFFFVFFFFFPAPPETMRASENYLVRKVPATFFSPRDSPDGDLEPYCLCDVEPAGTLSIGRGEERVVLCSRVWCCRESDSWIVGRESRWASGCLRIAWHPQFVKSLGVGHMWPFRQAFIAFYAAHPKKFAEKEKYGLRVWASVM